MARWFLHPLTVECNEIFARHFIEENFHEQFSCDNENKPVWEGTYKDIRYFLRNEDALRISFIIYKLEPPAKKAALWQSIVQRNKKKKVAPTTAQKQTFVQIDPKDDKSPFG